MTRRKRSIENRIADLQTAAHNGADNPAIREALTPFGYDAPARAKGQALVAAAREAQAQAITERSEQYLATKARDELRAEADQHLGTHRAMANVVFRNDEGARIRLRLTERQARPLRKWLAQAETFYRTLLGDEALIAAMAARTFGAEQLQANWERIQQIAALDRRQDSETSEAQQATKDRDLALEAAEDWVEEYLAIARIALAEQPQLMEALGVGVRS